MDRPHGLLGALACALLAGALTLPAPVTALAEGDVPEWAVDDGGGRLALDAQAEPPATYDLRDYGLVTPVKFQDPWGTCWAFGGIAAAETSVLSAAGMTYEESQLDLSERHLVYFALTPITADVNPTQAGEGIHLASMDAGMEANPNMPFQTGGIPILVSTLFATGVGPNPELLFPYRGAQAHTTGAFFNADKETAIREFIIPYFKVFAGGLTLEQIIDSGYYGSTPEEVYEGLYEDTLTYGINGHDASHNCYFEGDDWSIPELDADGDSNRMVTSGLALKDGNVLPDIKTDEGRLAAKRELLAGHGVSVSLKGADSGLSPKENINTQTWAQYTDESGADHGVCIVGWDDGYAQENFNEAMRPAGPGAWLVKNSWGSQTDAGPDDLGNVVNESEWGIVDESGRHTGYFWVSYEDKSLNNAETLDFSSGVGGFEGYYQLQYDYMPAQAGFLKVPASEDVVSTANVFEMPEDVKVQSVSTRTPQAATRVTFALYLLGEDAQSPTDGELVGRVSQDFAYAGYHRLDLDKPVRLASGQRLAVVSTASTEGEDGTRLYGASAAWGTNERVSQEHHIPAYCVAVVNEGESFLYRDGAWTDWADARADLLAEIDDDAADDEKPADYMVVDNFGIKVMAVRADPLTHHEAVAPTCEAPGSIEYWYDEEDGTCYADETGTTEIVQADTVLAALGHTWDAGRVTAQPTATRAGTRTFTCTRCGATRTEPIPATGVRQTAAAVLPKTGDETGALAGMMAAAGVAILAAAAAKRGQSV